MRHGFGATAEEKNGVLPSRKLKYMFARIRGAEQRSDREVALSIGRCMNQGQVGILRVIFTY